jgi:hypothetical protein
MEASSIVVYVQSKGEPKFHKLKVVDARFIPQYKETNNVDALRYDFAYLELEKNEIVREDQLIEPLWNWK